MQNAEMDQTVPHDEEAFERQLITHLQNIGGTKQWQYRPDIKTTDDLWANFRHILERNNTGKLGGRPLTDDEFNQIRRELLANCSSPYKAGQWLYGFNGVTQVEIHHDDETSEAIDSVGKARNASDPQNHAENNPAPSRTVFLTVFDQDQVGAGNTTYQIVNQIQRKPVRAGLPSRRFDTTLLINGLPIIQIEEKSAAHDVDEALRQEQRYAQEGQYGDIFSTLQILVGMTPYDCKYMAMTDPDHFSLDFSFRWQTEEGDPVYNWKNFADLMLSIPMAHQMATSYMILDGERGHDRLIVMRPYQVYATRRVITAIKVHDFTSAANQRIGYVWHTTGSGKTITSFKTAWLASRLPMVDKVIFLVDRIALTRQTYDKYRAYDPDSNDDSTGVVSDTRNVFDLARKLRSRQSGNSIIVTSIQKMGDLCKRDSFAPTDKRCVFICDEAHRSTNGDMVPAIRKKFPFSAWVGYTGTPLFDDDTTEKIFGHCLHAYTIKQGIADHNVLGFKVDFEHTLDSDEIKEKLLPEMMKARHPSWSDQQIHLAIARIEPEDADNLIDSGVYDMNEKHVRAVVKNILDHWANRSVDGRYRAILTTHVRRGASTPMAMMYFKEFLRQNKELKKTGGIPLNVAVTFSFVNSHSDDEMDNNDDLGYAMKIYNKEFGTHFDIESVDEYFADVAGRLSGDIGSNGPKLNLVIVVDQLLTGFDAPGLNTLYVDRTLSGASLIQAYSRTNRIDDNQYKPFGRIVNFRWPETSKELMNDALKVYANRDSAFDPQNDGGITTVVVSNDAIIEKVKDSVAILRSITHDFTEQTPADPEDLHACAQQLKIYNDGLTALKQDDSYDPGHPEKLLEKIGTTEGEAQQITALANTLRARSRSHDLDNPPTSSGEPEPPAIDLDFHVEHVGEERVNYSYLEKLLAIYLNARSTQSDDQEARLANFRQAAAQLDDQNKAKRLTDLAAAAQSAPDGKVSGVTYPVQPEDVTQIAVDNAKNRARTQILDFRTKWGLLDIEGSKQIIDRLISRHSPGTDDLAGEDMNTLLAEVTKRGYYHNDATDENIRSMGVFRYRNALTDALRHLADEVVREAPDL